MRDIANVMSWFHKENRCPCYREIVFPEPRVEVSQAFCLCRSSVINNRFASVCKGVFRIVAGWKGGIEIPDSAGERLICRKDSCDELRDFIPSGILATDVVDLHRRTAEAFPARRTVNDRLGTQEKSGAARPRRSLTIPAAWCQDGDSVRGFVIGERLAILRPDSNMFTGSLWSFEYLNLAK